MRARRAPSRAGDHRPIKDDNRHRAVSVAAQLAVTRVRSSDSFDDVPTKLSHASKVAVALLGILALIAAPAGAMAVAGSIGVLSARCRTYWQPNLLVSQAHFHCGSVVLLRLG